MDMEQLMAIVSRSNSGHLKPWKAQSMVATLTQFPEIRTDRARLTRYVDSSLAMEGFLDQFIDYEANDGFGTEGLKL